MNGILFWHEADHYDADGLLNNLFLKWNGAYLNFVQFDSNRYFMVKGYRYV